MICLFVILLLVLVPHCATQTPSATCDCTGADCEITEALKVNSLCATSVCIGGEGVAPASDDGCYNVALVDGVKVKAKIPGCCQEDTDCSAAACTQVECKKKQGELYGECIASRLPAKDCCTCKADCPPQACMTVQCVANDDNAPVLVKRSDGAHQMSSHHNSVMNTPGKCVYTPVKDKKCCDVSEDCNTAPNACPEGQQGICDGAKVCQCIASCKNECAKDEDCPPIDMSNPNWADKTCWINACVRGFCQPKRDTEIDQDGDGVKCGVDCDDSVETGAAFGETIYCTIGTKAEVDTDDDGFVRCGTEVEALCVAPDAECPDDRVKVPKENLGPESWEKGHFTVVKNCDCCDQNKNTEHPDSEQFCAIDKDKDGTFDCLPSAKKSSGGKGGRHGSDDDDDDDDCVCKQKFCVVVVGDPATDDDRDKACQEALNNDGAVAISGKDKAEPCGDECPDDKDAQEKLPYCPASVFDSNNDELTVCKVDPSFSGQSPDEVSAQLFACCAQIATILSGPSADKAKYQKFGDCCDTLTFPFTEYTTPECSADSQPFILDVCECDETRPDSTDCGTKDRKITCVYDRDGDCYFDCKNPKTTCVDLPTKITPDQKRKCGIELNTAPTDLTEEQLCCIEGLKTSNTATDEQSAEGYCDCNDADKEAHQLIACYKDEDQDGFPFCDKNNDPQCTQVCKAKCPAGFLGTSQLPCAGDRKRQAGSSLQDVQKVAASHEWFNSNDKPKRRNPCHDKKCDVVQQTIDETCADSGADACQGESGPLRCDCCDKDCVAFPGSLYASGSKTQCAAPDSRSHWQNHNSNNDKRGITTYSKQQHDEVADWNYNCDNGVQKYAACDLAKVIKAKDTIKCCAGALGGDNREVFLITDPKVFQYNDFVTAVPNLNQDTPAGSCPVGAGNVCPDPDQRGPEWDPNLTQVKRDLGHTKTDVPTFCENKKQSADGAASAFPFNTCASFLIYCYDSTPTDTTITVCAPSHDSCLKIGR